MLPRLFILNDQADQKYEAQLSKHLHFYEKIKPVIEVRRDRDIIGGTDEEAARKAAVDNADIVVLLLSPDLIASCYGLAQQALAQKKRVVPVMVRKTEWRETDFGGLRPLPRNEKPVELWADPDSAWVDVVQGLRGVWEHIAEQAKEATQALAAAAPYQPIASPPPPPQSLPKGAKVKVLFLTASPVSANRLAITEEFRRIKDRVVGSEHRDRFEFIFEPEVPVNQVGTALMRHRPHIVHFSGHGTRQGAIVLADPTQPGGGRPMDPTVLRQLFNLLARNLFCVVLNSCWSARDNGQAQALADVAGCVIGLADAIEDKSTIEFAASFYEALGFGESLQTAFDVAKVNIDAIGQLDAGLLRLFHRQNVDPAALTVIG